MNLPSAMFDEIVDHTESTAPAECCGLISGKDGEPLNLYRVTNADGDTVSLYLMDATDQFRALMDIEERGEELLAIYHSHPRFSAIPSGIDIHHAENWPDPLYLICSLQDDDPHIRAWHYEDEFPNAAMYEEELVVVE